MKRWFPLFALLSLLFLWASGCGGDDLFQNQTIGGDASTADGSSGGDATTGSDGSVTDGSVSDSGSDGSVSDGGEDSAVDAGDADVDSGFDAGIDAGLPFNVTAAASTGLTSMTVTFDGLPNATQAIDSANYVVTDGTTTLTLSGGSLDTATNTVTFTTTTQTATTFTVTVSNVTRDPDGKPLTNDIAMFTGLAAFDVSTAMATTNKTVDVTFDAPPEGTSAGTPGNYAISDGTNPLAVTAADYSGTGNTVKLTTDAQTGGTSYTVTVSGVTRASDTQPLSNNQASFTGRSSFNVTGAVPNSPTQVTVTFDSAPNGAGNTAGNFTIVDGSMTPLSVSAASVSGNTVVLTTATQSAASYTVSVANVARSIDGEPLATNSAGFTGIAPFSVTSASSVDAKTVTVNFSDTPDPLAAGLPGNYVVTDGIETLSVTTAVPAASGTSVTLTTSNQSAVTYTVTVSNVTRFADGLALSNNSATFTGTDGPQPHVTGVAVASTSPDNGTTPYNTGTSTVTITGSNFTGVVCPGGVRLDDLDGAGNAITGGGTHPTACSVDSDTQITATFPAGIRTNATAGWNVIVTNLVGSNAYSFQRFVPRAGLLVSEILIGNSTSSDDEYVEIYNPTSTTIDSTNVSGSALRLHIRSGTGTTDTSKTLTVINSSTGVIPSHGYLLFVSSTAVTNSETWATTGDYRYAAGLVANGSVYISLNATAQLNVIDKVGWGTQPAGGFEGSSITPSIPSGSSVQRKPAGGAGNATDSDVNANDFNAASTTLHHKGTTSGTEP